MSATDPVQSVVDSVLATLQSVAGLETQSWHVLSEEELMNRAKGVTTPAAAVVYEGLRRKSDQRGLVCGCGMAVLVFYRGGDGVGIGAMAGDQRKKDCMAMLKTIRDLILDSPGPGGHKWEFVSETPALEAKGLVVFAQRWTLTVSLL